MLSMTAYGGAGEIGGNKILLEDKGSKVFFDFGEEFNFGAAYFYDWLEPRVVNGMEVYFELGLMPRIPKLYSRSMLELSDMKYENPDIDAIFVSHAHSDHFGHVKFLDEEIPVNIGHGALTVIESYNALYKNIQDLGEPQHLNQFKSGDRLKAGSFGVTPIHVEHSIPGAYGFIIDTSRGAVIYSGDLRMHGPRSDLTKDFITKAAKAEPYCLILEGTRMIEDPERDMTEEEVAQKVDGIIKAAKGTVFCYFPMSNVDRFMSFYKSAVANERTLVIDTRLAYMVMELRKKVPVLPDVTKDRNIRVYFRLEKTCKFDDMDYNPKERTFCPKMITAKDISKKPKDYVVHMNFNKLMELVYINPKKADFIYSSSEHFLEGDQNEAQRTVWENWMGHYGIAWHKAHCSGHASREDLFKIVEAIKPKILVPVHTKAPEDFKEIHRNVVLPEKGMKLEL